MPELDVPRVRAVLAERRISHKRLAEEAGLSVFYVSRILCGTTPHGEGARIKIQRGLERLGLAPEVCRHA